METCQVTVYGKVCGKPAFCTFRKSFRREEKSFFDTLVCCEAHARNRTRINDTYEIQPEDKDRPFSEESSAYWASFDAEEEQESPRANPDLLPEAQLEEEPTQYYNAANQAFKKLSPREQGIFMALIIEGRTKSAVARQFGIKPQTVAVYIKRIKEKIEEFL